MILHGPMKRIRYIPLLDSGADYTTLTRNDALFLGLQWDEGESIEFSNSDGSSFNAKIFRLDLEIEQMIFSARICFIDSNVSAMPLLGRRDIFRRFKIIIDEAVKTVGLEI
jgi:hypothetical protein